MNRATADNQSAHSEEEGLEPTKEWVKDLVDEIIAEEFASPDLELHWLDEDADPAATETALEGRVKLGALTLNEMREHLGLDPYANPAADRPMVLTPTGYMPIEASAEGERKNGSSDANIDGASPVQKYSADQPRVPAGNPDGGQGVSEGGSGTSNDATARAAATASRSSIFGTRYAVLDTGARTDARNSPPGIRYAADPLRYSIDPSALTGISQIDDTTKQLLNILVDTSDGVGFLSGTPQYYGIAIHLAFGLAVMAEGIHGISPVDVERSFDLPEGYSDVKDSVRPDVVLRDDAGDIIAIYDVKTGDRGIDPRREDELRAATRVAPSVPVIELRLY